MSNDFRLVLREFGRGIPVVLLNGIGSPATHLHPLAVALSSDHRVLVPAFPGDGATPVYPGEYSTALEIQVLETTLQEHRVREAHIVGFSGGGYRALALSLSARIRAFSVVSLAGFASLPSDMRDGLRQSADAVRANQLPGTALVSRFLTPEFASAHPDVVAQVSGWIDAHQPDGLAQQLYAAADAPDLTSRVCDIHVPIVARSGERDVAVPYAFNKALADAAADGKFELVPNVGHLLLYEDFECTLASIRAATSA